MFIEKIKLNKDNLLKIKEIDDNFYTNENLSWDFYLERYNENHFAFVLKNEKKEIIGYVMSVPIEKFLYEAIKNGTMTNDIYINPKMFINKSNYNYIVSICIIKEYRNKGYSKLMFNKFLQETIEGNYISLTINKKGYNLASKYMNLIKEVNENTSIFEYIK